MKSVLTIILVLHTAICSPQCIQLDIMLVGDMSSSLSLYRSVLRDSFSEFNEINLSDNGIRIGALIFADTCALLSDITGSNNEFSNGINGVYPFVGSHTKLRSGMSAATNKLMSSRPGVLKMMIIITDGDPDDKHACSFIASTAKNDNIIVCTMYIGNTYCMTNDGCNLKEKISFLNNLSGGCFLGYSPKSLVDELKYTNNNCPNI